MSIIRRDRAGRESFPFRQHHENPQQAIGGHTVVDLVLERELVFHPAAQLEAVIEVELAQSLVHRLGPDHTSSKLVARLLLVVIMW